MGRNVNGHLFRQLLDAADYVDAECVDLLRVGASAGPLASPPWYGSCSAGAPVLGELPRSGLGEPLAPAVGKCIDKLWATRGERNSELLATLKEDVHAEELLRAAKADADAGWATQPMPLPAGTFTEALLHPRRATALVGPPPFLVAMCHAPGLQVWGCPGACRWFSEDPCCGPFLLERFRLGGRLQQEVGQGGKCEWSRVARGKTGPRYAG